MRDVANQSHIEFPGQGPVKSWTAPFLLIKISNEKTKVNVESGRGMSGRNLPQGRAFCFSPYGANEHNKPIYIQMSYDNYKSVPIKTPRINPVANVTSAWCSA